jgi:hypothetical protein
MSKILLFNADWCSTGDSLKLELTRVSSKPLYKEVDADSKSGSKLMKRYGVRVLPTLVKINDEDMVVEAITGYRHAQEVFSKFFEV